LARDVSSPVTSAAALLLLLPLLLLLQVIDAIPKQPSTTNIVLVMKRWAQHAAAAVLQQDYLEHGQAATVCAAIVWTVKCVNVTCGTQRSRAANMCDLRLCLLHVNAVRFEAQCAVPLVLQLPACCS
jgi:hypothetical protein